MAVFFALYGRVAFLCLSKEKSPKERIPNMPALRVPCDARMSRQDAELAALRQTHPEIPGSSCASRRAWTGIEGQPPYLPSFRYASSRNPFFILFLDTGLRRHDGRIVKEFLLNVTGAIEQALTWFLILQSLLCCRALEA